jgi:hypothetical protein
MRYRLKRANSISYLAMRFAMPGSRRAVASRREVRKRKRKFKRSKTIC